MKLFIYTVYLWQNHNQEVDSLHFEIKDISINRIESLGTICEFPLKGFSWGVFIPRRDL